MEKEKVKNQIKVGDRVTHKGFEKIRTSIAINDDFFDWNSIDILKIERIGRNGWYTVYEKQSEILDEKEKEYLRAVIKPFKKKVKYIHKRSEYAEKNKEYIRIVLNAGDTLFLPEFKQNTMYKNMEKDRKYSLKELGLE